MCETPGLRFLLITYVPKLERLDGMAVSDAERRGRQRGAAPPPVAAIMPPEAPGTQLTPSAGAAGRSQPARDGSPDAPMRLGGEADEGAGVGGRTRGGMAADGDDAHWHAGALTTLAAQGRVGKAAGTALAVAAPSSDDEPSDDGDGNEMPEWVRHMHRAAHTCPDASHVASHVAYCMCTACALHVHVHVHVHVACACACACACARRCASRALHVHAHVHCMCTASALHVIR